MKQVFKAKSTRLNLKVQISLFGSMMEKHSNATKEHRHTQLCFFGVFTTYELKHTLQGGGVTADLRAIQKQTNRNFQRMLNNYSKLSGRCRLLQDIVTNGLYRQDYIKQKTDDSLFAYTLRMHGGKKTK